MNLKLMRSLGKQAAYMLPPTSRGKRVKGRRRKRKLGITSKNSPASNRQSPHRYGRKLTGKKQ